MSVALQWITPDAERMIVETARVSSDPDVASQPDASLIAFLIRNQHWSPFEMANLCIEVRTTRDIGRQMLRHWTMRPQEFSQRYQSAHVAGDPIFREARMQHPTNRQASVPCDDEDVAAWWRESQEEVWKFAANVYAMALNGGIAKEVARAVLPEGITPTRMFFNASIRSAIHFCTLRMGNGSQSEIVEIAEAVWRLMGDHLPAVVAAVDRAGLKTGGEG